MAVPWPRRRAVRAIHIGAHAPGLAIGVAESPGGETVEVATVTRRGRSNGLRVALRARRRRQHTRRRGVRLRGVGGRVHAGHDGGSRGPVHVVSRRGKPRQVRPVRLAHVRMRRGRLSVMRLEGRQRVWLRHRVLRLHRVLRHRHTRDGSRGEWRGALRQAGGGRPRRVRSGIHDEMRSRETRVETVGLKVSKDHGIIEQGCSFTSHVPFFLFFSSFTRVREVAKRLRNSLFLPA